MNRIALLFDRAYVDTQACFTELACQLAKLDFAVDLYMPMSSNNHQPFFEDSRIRILPFPISKFQKAEYWYKIYFDKDRRYKAIVATPVQGVWVAYNTSKIQKIPYYYFADELIEQIILNKTFKIQKKLIRQNYFSNKHAIASIALSEERYNIQKFSNKIDYPHDHIVIPNSQSGEAQKLKSNYFRDYFNIEDRKPILLFAGTLSWNLAKKIYEETKTYGERDYHLIFHARTLGLMGGRGHPFIKISNIPLPSSVLNYAMSSADIGLALYDKNISAEVRNSFTGGKIGSYLKNELPIIVGSAEELKIFDVKNVGIYWDGESAFDEIAHKSILNLESCKKNIGGFYKEYLQYELFFENFRNHLMKSIR